MRAIAAWPPCTHSPSPVIPASVSIRTQMCMQWPAVAAVFTVVIFMGGFRACATAQRSWRCSWS